MRITLTVDDKLIAQAMIALDAATHADAIDLALQRVVTKHRYQQIQKLRGQLDWSGDVDHASNNGTTGMVQSLILSEPAPSGNIPHEQLGTPIDEK